MENGKNVQRSKMSLAALKAWETRRKNAASSSKKNVENKKEKKERKVKDSGKAVGLEADEFCLKADEQREMKALNGVELEQIAKETKKRLDRRDAMENAKNGRNISRAVIVGKIIKKAKIERHSGGVKFSKVVA